MQAVARAFKAHIIESNQASGWEVDTFIHTWHVDIAAELALAFRPKVRRCAPPCRPKSGERSTSSHRVALVTSARPPPHRSSQRASSLHLPCIFPASSLHLPFACAPRAALRQAALIEDQTSTLKRVWGGIIERGENAAAAEAALNGRNNVALAQVAQAYSMCKVLLLAMQAKDDDDDDESELEEEGGGGGGGGRGRYDLYILTRPDVLLWTNMQVLASEEHVT